MDGHAEKNLPPVSPESLAKLSDDALFTLLRTPVPVELVVANALRLSPNIFLLPTEIETTSVAINTPISQVSATDTDSDVKRLIGLLDPPEHPDELARLPGYRLMRVLGVGGMGIVFQAEDLKLNRHVAIKLIRPKRFKDKHATQRFLTEARSSARLTHDNIVTVHHVGQNGDIPYLVMQLLAGQSLADRMRQEKKLDVLAALQIARQIAQGLAAAHVEGMVHRDIKPDNIWLEAPSDRVKILDFGLAQLALPNAELSDDAVLVGTPNYIAPERIRGQPGDLRSDLFSLGVVLYEMLSGHRPFQASGVTGTLQLGIQHDPEPLPPLPASFDSQTRLLVGKLLEKDPQRRTTDATELIAQIDRTLALGFPDPKPDAQRRFNWKWTLGLCLVAIIAIAVYLLAHEWSATGAVLLEATPDSISSLDDLDFTVRDLKTGEIRAMRLGELKLKPGSYRLEPSAVEGVKFARERFEVVAGRSESIDVSYVPDLTADSTTEVSNRLVDPIWQWSGLASWTLETKLHRGLVLALDRSFDGRWLATGGADGTVRIWSTTDLSLATILLGHDDAVTQVAWSPNANRLLSASRKKLILWDTIARQKIAESTTASDEVRVVRWAPDGSKFMNIDERSALTIHSAQTLEIIESHSDGYIDARWRDDSKATLVLRNDGQFENRLLDAWQLGAPTKLQVDPKAHKVITRNGQIAASLAQRGLQVSEIESGKDLPLPNFEGQEIQNIWAIAGDEQFVAQIRDSSQTWLKLWDGRNGAVLQEWKYPGRALGELRMTWDSREKNGFVFVPGLAPENDLLRLEPQSAQPVSYRVAYGVEVETSTIGGWIDDFSYSHDGKRLAIAYGLLDIWDVETGEFVRECKGFRHDARFIRWTADDSRVAVDTTAKNADDLNIYLVDPNRDGEQLLYADSERADGDRYASRVLAEDGGWFLGSNGAEMTVISTSDPSDRRRVSVTLAKQETIVGRSISNQGQIALAINQGIQGNSCVRLIDSANQITTVEIRMPEPVDELYWSPDGSMLVARCTSGRAHAISPIDGAIRDLFPLRQPIRALSWSIDSSRLAVITQSNIGLIWDHKTNRKICSFSAATVQRPTVKWHPSGDLISYNDIWGRVVTISAISARIANVMLKLPGSRMYWIWPDGKVSTRDGKVRYDDDIVISVSDPAGNQSTIPRVSFFPDNGHYYEFVPATRIVWNTAKEQAERKILVDSNGMDRQGYLATITTSQEQTFLEQNFGLLRMVWVGGSDQAEDGQWRWVTGPEGMEDGEQGRLFWTGAAAASGGQPIGNQYTNWIPPDAGFLGEPNNLFDEDYLIWNHDGSAMGVRGQVGLWNDQMNNSPREGDIVAGYLVEYGD